MTSTHRPPVIPEIAKAYTNDPRTQLALAAMKAGQSTAPVATGGYGVADGIARVLNGGLGGYFNKQQQDKYGADEAQLLALRQQRGVDGMSGAAAPPQAPGPAAAAPVVPPDPTLPQPNAAPQSVAITPQMQAAASALGSAPPAPPPSAGMPGIPTAPIPPPAPPQAMGGGPQGQLPFAPGSAPATAVNRPVRGAAAIAPPVPQAIPDAPAPMAKPVAPAAVGPTQSGVLKSAYKIMSDANPYESAAGQDMYAQGLSDQDKLNEDAAKRKQEIQDAVYGADRNQYDQSESQARGAQYADRAAVQARNYAGDQAYANHVYKSAEDQAANDFTGGQNDKNRANALQLERMRASSALAVANTNNSGGGGDSTSLQPDERAALSKAVGDGRIDLKGITKFQAKVVAQALIDNPNLDAIHLHSMANVAANPAAQQKAMLVSAMPTVLGNVRDAGKKLNFSDVAFAGKLQGFLSGQTNDPDFVNYMTQRNDAMQTLSSVMRNTGATDLSTKLESDAAPKTMSPRAWDAWYQAQMAAIKPRIQAYEDRKLLPSGTTASIYPAAATPSAGGWGKATVVGR